MVPQIQNIEKISPDQTVVCIMGSDDIHPSVKLSPAEKEYIKRCMVDSPDYVVVNSYFKLTILIREDPALSDNAQMEKLREISVKVVEELRSKKQQDVAIISHKANSRSVIAFAEGLILSKYSFTKYKSAADPDNKNNHYPESILIQASDLIDLKHLKTLSEAVYFARDRVNEPLSHLNAEGFADSIKDFCADADLKVDILTRKRIEALRMGGIIAVNRGSNDPPTLSVIEWKPENCINSKPVVLVGKGVVFDTGGLKLKPTNYIEEMKADMAGGAAVASVMYYIAKTELPLHVMAFIPATDNRPGQDAYAPGDVITMYNGKSVEVLNTDAEGRLILADALSYGDKFEPSLIMSIATLTGSAANAFGNKAIAVMGNAGSDYFDLLEEAGDNVYERTARMPFWKDYGEMLKSDIADLKNVGGREAGAITAGKFLENFTSSPFIHLDIAGTAMLTKKDHYRPKGGTGSGVRLLTEFFRLISESDNKNIKLI
jgi:leucyl aminopeptidase